MNFSDILIIVILVLSCRFVVQGAGNFFAANNTNKESFRSPNAYYQPTDVGKKPLREGVHIFN